MTEAQEIRNGEPGDEHGPDREPTIVTDGGTWVLVESPDGDAWDLYSSTTPGSTGPDRLAQITVRELGYFSIDSTGIERGPYTTLDEAAYPIGNDDPVLLDDPGTRSA